jgi:2-methylisocitrate lyase-like PEP mutase family enzyme
MVGRNDTVTQRVGDTAMATALRSGMRDPRMEASRHMDGISPRTRAFHALHQSGTFVMPNPWDAGSARMLAALGFPALATTSAGFAWSRGQRDNAVALDAILLHLETVCVAVGIPVNADFENGFAIDPDAVAINVSRAVSTGVSGLSIEDSTGDERAPLHPFELAVDRIAAARHAIDASGTGVLLTGRSEGFICGRPDLRETLRRLEAYAEAGADCLYAPGVRSADDIAAIVAAVRPKPVNVLVGSDFTTVNALAVLGVRRISIGGALARVAWTAAINAAREIAHSGTFGTLTPSVSGADIEASFGG